MIHLSPSALPVHQRSTSTFDEIFARPAAEVLESMDAALDDMVERAPHVAIPVQRAGLERHAVIVQVRDPFGSDQIVPAVCAVRIATAVPSNRRGLHMSRIGDVIANGVQQTHVDVSAFATMLATAIGRCQYGGPTTVRVRARVPFIEELPVERRTTKQSLEQLTLLAAVRTDGGDEVLGTDRGIRVTHIVACPCVQQTLRHAQGPHDRAPAPVMSPALTHSQRCRTTIVVRCATRALAIPNVLRELDAVLHRTCNTLPRGRELQLVLTAHQSPQFIEDAVRDAIAAMYRALDPQDGFDRIEATSTSVESIHDFDLAASSSVSREDARRVLQTPHATRSLSR